MLTALVPRLLCAQCRDAITQLELLTFNGTSDRVADGVLRCGACGAWYPIQDGLLELVSPGLLDVPALARFRERFAGELAAQGLTDWSADSNVSESPQLKQRRHFDWFADQADQTYDEYQQSAFWRSVDRLTFRRWTQAVHPGDWLLDVGCANGRSAWPFAGTGATIVGCDISRKLIAQAIAHASQRQLARATTFFVADADRLPFRDATFEFVVTYGALHHLPNPGGTCRDIQRLTRPGGVHLASENNKSGMRALFDLLMRVKPLWVEEAGEEPLISERMVRDWVAGLDVEVRCRTHVFVPPHLVNLLGQSAGGALLAATDALLARVPVVGRNGGLIVFEIRKAGRPHA